MNATVAEHSQSASKKPLTPEQKWARFMQVVCRGCRMEGPGAPEENDMA